MFNEAQHQTLSENESANFDELYSQYLPLYIATFARADQDTRKLQSIYDEYRELGIYKKIKQKIAADELVSQMEYCFYALVTDDVSSLDPNKLDANHSIKPGSSGRKYHEPAKAIGLFTRNLCILAAALRYQNNPTLETFSELKLQLDSRAQQNLAHKDGGLAVLPVVFLNLSGITLPGLTQRMEKLRFHWCDFSKGKLSSRLSFEAVRSIFSETNLDADMSAARSYSECELINVNATIVANTACSFYKTNIINSKLSITISSDLCFEDCEISMSEIAINGGREGEVGRLHSCRVLCSRISVDQGVLRWQRCIIIRADIINDLTRMAKHDFKGGNIIDSTELRKEQIVDFMKFLMSDQFPAFSVRFYEDRLFASPEAFREFLTSIHKDISAHFRKLFDNGHSIYKDVEKVQEVFAKLFVAHIKGYYPFESHALEAITLLEEALKHPVFNNQNQVGLKSIFGSLFAACSTSTKAREVLSNALNGVTMNCSQHTALSRLASF